MIYGFVRCIIVRRSCAPSRRGRPPADSLYRPAKNREPCGHASHAAAEWRASANAAVAEQSQREKRSDFSDGAIGLRTRRMESHQRNLRHVLVEGGPRGDGRIPALDVVELRPLRHE